MKAKGPPRSKGKGSARPKGCASVKTAEAKGDAQNKVESGSEPLANARHERFACELAKGVSQAEAYKKAGYKPDTGAASRLSAKISIQARVAWIKSQAAASDVLTIAEKRDFLARLVRCKPANEPADSDLWNGIEDTEQGKRYKLPDKLRAIALDNDLAGEGAEAGGNKALGELVKRLRK